MILVLVGLGTVLLLRATWSVGTGIRDRRHGRPDPSTLSQDGHGATFDDLTAFFDDLDVTFDSA